MNIAMDARINAFLHRYMDMDAATFFDRIYREIDSPELSLLNPGLDAPDRGWPYPEQQEYQWVFEWLYYDKEHKDIVGYKDIYDILVRNAKDGEGKSIFIGNHGQLDLGDADDIPQELKDALKDLVKEKCKSAGKGENASSSLIDEVQGIVTGKQ